jgi:hypothetical protein
MSKTKRIFTNDIYEMIDHYNARGRNDKQQIFIFFFVMINAREKREYKNFRLS